MKNFLIAICLLAIPITSFSQNQAINKFYRQHKKGKAVKNFKVPGWLIHLGGNIAKKQMKEKDAKMALNLVKYLKGTRLMFSDGQNPVPVQSVKQLTDGVRKKGFDDWILVRDGETRVNIMAREKNGKIKNLMILVNEEDTFVMVSSKMRLKTKHLAAFLQEIIRKEFKDPEPEPEKKKKPAKKKRPIA